MDLNLKITIIGISDQKQKLFSTEVRQKIELADHFAGGKRHYQKVVHLLPENSTWTFITVPLEHFWEELRSSHGHWVVFASGDPLFFGIGNTLKREFPDVEIEILPSFNSLQQLAHRTAIPYGMYRTISLTGRPWSEFDAALIAGEPRLALLTDRTKTPGRIASRMLEYGYNQYLLTIGECLGGKEEKIREFSVSEAAEKEFSAPNCLFITQVKETRRLRGIPDDRFLGLTGRPNMITKMPVRLITLALMQLQQHSVFWDVGACTGSISIEAKIQFPHLQIRAFEVRPECEKIILPNCRTFGVPGIDLHIGDYLQADKSALTKPDAVFLGGYGGQMDAVLDDLGRHLQPQGLIAFNAVSEESLARFTAWSGAGGFYILAQTRMAVDQFNPITIVVIKRKNEGTGRNKT